MTLLYFIFLYLLVGVALLAVWVWFNPIENDNDMAMLAELGSGMAICWPLVVLIGVGGGLMWITGKFLLYVSTLSKRRRQP